MNRKAVQRVCSRGEETGDGEDVDLTSVNKSTGRKREVLDVYEKLVVVPLNKQGVIWSIVRHVRIPKKQRIATLSVTGARCIQVL